MNELWDIYRNIHHVQHKITSRDNGKFRICSWNVMRKQNRWSLIFDAMRELHLCYNKVVVLLWMHLDNLWFHRHQPEMHHFVHWTLSKPQSIAPAGFHMPMQFNAMKGLICSLCISLTVAQLYCCTIEQQHCCTVAAAPNLPPTVYGARNSATSSYGAR